MVRYLCLINFTDQGMRDVHYSTARAKAFRSEVKKAGGKVTSQYWTMGEVDGCFILEAPDDQVAAELLLKLGRHGFVRSRSMRLLDEAQFAAASGDE